MKEETGGHGSAAGVTQPLEARARPALSCSKQLGQIRCVRKEYLAERLLGRVYIKVGVDLERAAIVRRRYSLSLFCSRRGYIH